MYLGVDGGRKLLLSLATYLSLKLNVKELEKDFNELEQDLKTRGEELSNIQRKAAMSKLKGKLGEDMNYIG